MSRSSKISEARLEDDCTNSCGEWGRFLGHRQSKKADAAGSMQVTLRDFARFMQAVIEGEGLEKSTRELVLGPQIRRISKYQFPTLEAVTGDGNEAFHPSCGPGRRLYWRPHGKALFKEGHDAGS